MFILTGKKLLRSLLAFFVLITTLIVFLSSASSSLALANTPPEIVNHGISPEIAAPGNMITFWLWYRDADGDPPEYVRIHLYDGSYEMKKMEGVNYIDKVKYQYQRQATAEEGSLEFYLEVSDGQTTARGPNYEDGSYLAEVLAEKVENNQIYFFLRDNPQPLWYFKTGSDWIQNISLSHDGAYIAVKTTDYIYLFNKKSPIPIWKRQCNSDLGQNKESFAGWVDVSADGRYLVGGCQQDLSLVSIEEKRLLWVYPTDVYTVAIAADGEWLAVGTYQGRNEVLVFNKNNPQPRWSFRGESDMHALAISADGYYVAAGAHCPDRRAFLFRRESNQPKVAFKTSEDSPVWAATISDDGRYAVYGLDGGDGFSNILVFSPDKKKPFNQYSVNSWVRSVDISANGDYFAAGSANKSIYLFSPQKRKPFWQYQTKGKVGSVAISKEGDYLVAGSQDKNVYLFNQKTNQPLWSFETNTWVNAVAISGDGQYLAAGTGAQQYLGEMHSGLKGSTEEQEEKVACEGEDCEKLSLKGQRLFIIPIIGLIVIITITSFFFLKKRKQ